jgi:ABC-type nitrate/sulfonate/bicarbonate transport system permease component
VRPDPLPALTVALTLGLWEIAPRAGWVRRASVPPVSDVAGEVVRVLGEPGFAEALGASATRWAAGLGIAILIGVPLGTAMGRSRALHVLVDPLLVAGYPVPKAALILVFTLWWGAGDPARIAIVVIGCLIPIVVSSYHGALAVPPALLWSARGLGTSRLRTWTRVILPAALPSILSGLRLAIGIAIFTVLASELLIRGSGLGALLFGALDNGQTLMVFAVSTIVAAVGFLVDLAYAAGVRRAVPWLEADV